MPGMRCQVSDVRMRSKSQAQTQHPVQDAPRRRQTIVCRSLCHFFFSAVFFFTAVLFPERRLISVRRWLALESRSRP